MIFNRNYRVLLPIVRSSDFVLPHSIKQYCSNHTYRSMECKYIVIYMYVNNLDNLEIIHCQVPCSTARKKQSGRHWQLVDSSRHCQADAGYYSFSRCWLSLERQMPGQCGLPILCQAVAPGYKLDALPMHCRFRADPCPMS